MLVRNVSYWSADRTCFLKRKTITLTEIQLDVLINKLFKDHLKSNIMTDYVVQISTIH